MSTSRLCYCQRNRTLLPQNSRNHNVRNRFRGAQGFSFVKTSLFVAIIPSFMAALGNPRMCHYIQLTPLMCQIQVCCHKPV
jgi:hypothetical protein